MVTSDVAADGGPIRLDRHSLAWRIHTGPGSRSRTDWKVGRGIPANVGLSPWKSRQHVDEELNVQSGKCIQLVSHCGCVRSCRGPHRRYRMRPPLRCDPRGPWPSPRFNFWSGSVYLLSRRPHLGSHSAVTRVTEQQIPPGDGSRGRCGTVGVSGCGHRSSCEFRGQGAHVTLGRPRSGLHSAHFHVLDSRQHGSTYGKFEVTKREKQMC